MIVNSDLNNNKLATINYVLNKTWNGPLRNSMIMD